MEQGEIFLHKANGVVSTSVAVNGKLSIAEATDMGEGKWLVNRVNVANECRRTGWGSKLLSRLTEELSKDSEVKTIKVFPGGYNTDMSVLESFYEKNGFIANEDKSIFTFTPKR